VSAYIDTSVLVAYYCPEPLSRRAEAALRRLRRPVISTLCEVEVVSALSRKVRSRLMGRADARRVLEQLGAHVAAGLYEMAPIDGEHFARARDWLARMDTPLRTLDALHLAVAGAASVPILTADAALARAARRLKLGARLLRSPPEH